MDDACRALKWLRGCEGVSPERIAIGGNSAGGGLAAGLVQLAHDRGEVRVAFQLLVYPMLDDRTVLRTDIDPSPLRLWNNRSNRFGWTSYLGAEPGGPKAVAYAAPGRREDLAGLPPAWIGVGTCDLFHDEDVDYARRLEAAGVPCTLKVVPGAFQAFDRVCSDTEVTRDFIGGYRAALREALGAGGGEA
jgi:acetyl esterase/lipase